MSPFRVTSSFDVLLLSTSKYTKITNIKKYLYFFIRVFRVFRCYNNSTYTFFCVFRVLSGHFFTFLPVSKIHAHKDESRAEKEPNGDLLVEQPPGEENGGDGIEVDPVCCDHRAEFADDPVPDKVTEH